MTQVALQTGDRGLNEDCHSSLPERHGKFCENRHLMTTDQRAWARVRFADEMFAAGLISEDERVFGTALAVEHVVAIRIARKASPTLESISGKLSELIRCYGLDAVQCFPKAGSFDDVTALGARYTAVYDALHEAAFHEFGASDLAVLFRNNRSRFDELREAGRQRLFKRETRH